MAAVRAPNERVTLVHRVGETLRIGDRAVCLSSQSFADGTPPEEGYRAITGFCVDGVPQWHYQVSGVQVRRSCAMVHGENTTALWYRLENRSGKKCTLTVEPFVKLAPKETALEEEKKLSYDAGTITDGVYTVHIQTDGELTQTPVCWQTLAYSEDAKDGRPEKGMAGSCCVISKTLAPGETSELGIVFSEKTSCRKAAEVVQAEKARLSALAAQSGFRNPAAK